MITPNANSSAGVGILAETNSGDAVNGAANSGTGVVGFSDTGRAGLFFGGGAVVVEVDGALDVVGTVTKSGGGFKNRSPARPG